jgi:cell wall-associated NlpC family hydrolase
MTTPSFNDIIGLPFKPGGTGLSGANPGGFDCYSLAREVFHRYGIELPETNISVLECARASQQEIEKQMAQYWVRTNRLMVPCGVQIFSSNPGFANHIATYIGKGRVIHITLKTKVVVQRLSTIQKQKIEGFYKYVGPSC